MGRKVSVTPVDLCLLHIKPKRSIDPQWEARKFSTVIAPPEFDKHRDLVSDVFTSVGLAKSDMPEVWIHPDGTIIFKWSEDRYHLNVKVTSNRVVSYYVSRDKAEDPKWIPITNGSTVEEVLFRLGRYITGSPETECGGDHERKAS